MTWFIGFWVVCGVLAYGLTFAHFQRKFPNIAKEKYGSDMTFSLFVGGAGPIGLLALYMATNGDLRGFKWV